MKLENCTREELLYFIKQRCFVSDDEVALEILHFRIQKTIQEESHYAEIASQSLQRYLDLMNPYEKKSLLDIPDSTFQEAAKAMEAWISSIKKRDREHKKWVRLNRQLDAILLHPCTGNDS